MQLINYCGYVQIDMRIVHVLQNTNVLTRMEENQKSYYSKANKSKVSRESSYTIAKRGARRVWPEQPK